MPVDLAAVDPNAVDDLLVARVQVVQRRTASRSAEIA
jgi:hypothetical protein